MKKLFNLYENIQILKYVQVIKPQTVHLQTPRLLTNINAAQKGRGVIYRTKFNNTMISIINLMSTTTFFVTFQINNKLT